MYKEYKINELIKISEMFSLFSLSYRQDYVFKGEVHNFWECVIVLDGAICVSADERVYKMQKYDIIFHKPLELHKFYIDSPKGAKLFIFSFSMQGPYAEFFENKVFSLKSYQQRCVSSLLEFLKSKDADDLDFVKNLSQGGIYSQMAVTYIYQLFLSLIDEDPVAGSAVHHESDAKVFSSVVRFMTQNIADFISVADIAKIHNISEALLKHIFKKYAGMGVHQYFLTLKINTAKQMLTQGNTAADISDKLGFSSQNYFSYAFKRETGCSPSKFKKENSVTA